MIYLIALILINAYLAWRYSGMPIEPDYSVYAMWGVTGAKYGKDFVDCKSPLPHLWLALIGKVTKNIKYMRLIYFFVTGLPSIIYFAITGNFAGALAFLVVVHSGWLYAFHGNVGDMPAGLIFLALLIPNPWIFVGLLVLATLYEPKIIVATGLMVLFRITEVWIPTLVYVGVFAMFAAWLWYAHHNVFSWIIESAFVIPSRMQKFRKGKYPYMPWYTSMGLLYISSWLIVGVIAKPDILFWIPPVVFLLFQFTGRVVRPNHLIPLAAWIGAAGIDPVTVYILSCVDFVTAGLYIGDIWVRFYAGLANIVKEARDVGLWLKDKPGILWVNSMYCEVYLYANKKPEYGMMEVVELNKVATERRKIMRSKIEKNPPDWIVLGDDVNVNYDYSNYKQVARTDHLAVLKRKTK